MHLYHPLQFKASTILLYFSVKKNIEFFLFFGSFTVHSAYSNVAQTTHKKVNNELYNYYPDYKRLAT